MMCAGGNAASRGEAIVFGPTLVLRGPPLALHQAAVLQAVEGRVERALLYLERVVAQLLDPARDAESVHRLPAESLEDNDVQAALEEVHRSR